MFDPEREAIVLVAGDKTGQWNHWYETAIPPAEQRYGEWAAEKAENEQEGPR